MNERENRKAGEQSRYWYRLTGLTTIILFLLAVMLFLTVFPLIFGIELSAL